jgi:formyl-CoA transferase
VVRREEVSETGHGTLQGIRVVEVGQMIAGPFYGHLFADQGAEVMKVEAPGEGNVMRR